MAKIRSSIPSWKRNVDILSHFISSLKRIPISRTDEKTTKKPCYERLFSFFIIIFNFYKNVFEDCQFFYNNITKFKILKILLFKKGFFGNIISEASQYSEGGKENETYPQKTDA